MQKSLISIFSLFVVFSHDFIINIDFPVSQLQQQLMTQEIRSHLEYLILTCNIPELILWTKNDEKYSPSDGF